MGEVPRSALVIQGHSEGVDEQADNEENIAPDQLAFGCFLSLGKFLLPIFLLIIKTAISGCKQK